MQDKMQGLVSVIVPIYKVEEYLDRCLSSITQQTYKNLEIILVDDGSPDACPEMCNAWKEKDDRVVVIHKTNGGLSSARNAGIDVAAGDYVAFVDSDDYIANDMIETMLNAAVRHDVEVACCGRIRVTEHARVEMFTLPKEQILSGEEALKQLLTGDSIEEAAWDKLYKRSVFREKRFPVGEINEDVVQTVKILGDCGKIVHVGKALYYYCENKNSITTSKYSPKKKIYLKHLDEIKLYLSENYSQLLHYYFCLETRYCQCLLYLLLDNKETYNKFERDYVEIFERFRHAFKKSHYGQGQTHRERMKGLLIYHKWYYWLHSVKLRRPI